MPNRRIGHSMTSGSERNRYISVVHSEFESAEKFSHFSIASVFVVVVVKLENILKNVGFLIDEQQCTNKAGWVNPAKWRHSFMSHFSVILGSLGFACMWWWWLCGAVWVHAQRAVWKSKQHN